MERQLPVNIEAEQAVISGLLMERDAILAVADLLQSSDFYFSKYGLIYGAILDCYSRRVPPDLITVSDVLDRQGKAREIGGYDALLVLAQFESTAQHVEHYARIVRRYAKARRVIQAGATIASLGYDVERDEADIDGDMMKLVTETHGGGGVTDTSMGGAFDDLCKEWEHGVPPNTPTRLIGIDDKIGGLFPGDLLILAARPGVGKSSLSSQIALNVAFGPSAGKVHMFSLEMGKKQVLRRMMASRLNFDHDRIKLHQFTSAELPRLMECAGAISESGITVDDTESLTIGTLRARALRHIATHGKPALLIVDYLGLLKGDGKYKDNRVQEVSDISRGLKILAREADVPVLALCQLNRAIEHRASHMPQLSDLRESGSIEQDADIVMFIARDTEQDATPDGYQFMNVGIAKHRNGPLGIVPLQFNGATHRWRDGGVFVTPVGYGGPR
jgi:replicative DNA helicase